MTGGAACPARTTRHLLHLIRLPILCPSRPRQRRGRVLGEDAATYGDRGGETGRGAGRSRELEVISMVAAGSSNAEIGTALGIDERTVESHLRRLFDRYGTDSRTELITHCVRAGWIDLSAE